jgi:SNF2 family DNA or RNA helicase
MSIMKLRAQSAWFITATYNNCKGADLTPTFAEILKTITDFHDVSEELYSFTWKVTKADKEIEIEPFTLGVKFDPIEEEMVSKLENVISTQDKAAGYQTLSHYYFLPWKLFNIKDDMNGSLTINNDTNLSLTAAKKRRILSGNVYLASALHDTGHFVKTYKPDRKIYVGPYIHTMLYADIFGIVDVMGNTTDKIIVFTEFNDEIDLLQDVLDSLYIGQVAIISGSVSSQDKANAIASFRESSNVRIILVNKKIGDTGLNLQVANWIYMLTIDTDPSRVEQCLGRAARQGQKNTVRWVSVVGRSRPEESALTKQRNLILNTKESIVTPKLEVIEIHNEEMILRNDNLKRML